MNKGEFERIESYADPASGFKKFSDSVQLPFTAPGYTLFVPRSEHAESVIIFFQDSRPDLNSAEELSVCAPAMKNGAAVAFVATGSPLDFLFEETDLQKLDSLVHRMLSSHKLEKAKLLFAGLSLSGTRAARYAIYCEANRSRFGIHPKALAVCDAPLDLCRFYREHKKAYTLNFDPLAYSTGALIIPYLERTIGTPAENQDLYRRYSTFCEEDSIRQNTSILRQLPVRAYHQPDIDWWLRHRRKDYYGMNSIDLAGFIRQLQIVGSTCASLITVNRRQGDPEAKSPHSWDIVDSKELVDWFLSLK